MRSSVSDMSTKTISKLWEMQGKFIAPRLVSELVSEGASGRLFSQTPINKNATRFEPICSG